MISLTRMREWFEEETEDSVRKIRQEIRKRMDSIKSSFTNLKETAADFEVKETVDAESRSSQNIYEKMIEMVDGFVFPEVITYKGTEEFIKDLEKVINRVVNVGRRFIPNLGKKYKTRVFLLNRALTRIQKGYNDFFKFFEEKTVLMKEVDETADNISLLLEKVREREELKKQIVAVETEAEKIEDKISDLDASATNLESRKALVDLEEINKEMTIAIRKLRLQLGSLDKPLRKLASRVRDGIVNLRPDLVELATQLREDPKRAFWNMSEGHKELTELLSILIEAIKSEKIKLRASAASKTVSLAEGVINGSISEIYNEILELKERSLALEARVEELGLKDKIQEFKDKQETLEKEEERKRRRIRDLESELAELNDEIVELAASTQKKVRELTDQDLKINIKE